MILRRLKNFKYHRFTYSIISILFFMIGLHYLFDAQIPKNYNKKPFWLLSIQDQKYKYAILGSSRTLSGINPDILAKNTENSSVINLSLDGTGYSELYLLLHEFLKTNTVESIVLCADIYMLDDRFLSEPFHVYYYLPFLGNSKIDEILFDLYPEKFYLWKWVPFLKYGDYNRKIGLKALVASYNGNFANVAEGHQFHSNKGSMSYIDTGFVRKRYTNGLISVSEQNIKYFEKIIAMCKEKKIPVFLVNVPDLEIVQQEQKNRKEILSIFAGYTDDIEVYKIRDIGSEFYKDLKNFYNYTHLNANGANIYSKFLANEIKSIKRSK